MYNNILLLFAFIALAAARSVKFSLIALNATNVKVKIGSTSYTLRKYSTYAPVYQATLTVSDSALT